MSEEKRSDHLPPLFLSIGLSMQRTARERGYALCFHGSMVRDLDIVAVPWTEEAVSAEELMDALAEHLGWTPESLIHEAAEQKPHGRLAYSIWLGRDKGNEDRKAVFLDISVMPRVEVTR